MIRRLVIAFLISFAGLYFAALGVLYVYQRNLLYLPNAKAVAPSAVGFDAQETAVATADGERLLAWYKPAAAGRALILYFHGNGGGLDGRGERFRKLTSRGDGLLAVEYRGYAGSTGSPSEAGLIEDGEATYGAALRLGADPSRIVLFGESLGSGVAVALAAKHRVAALVLDSPYTSIADVASSRYWMFPTRLLVKDAFRSDERIAEVAAPLLVVHGDRDDAVPIRFGERLFALAHEPKTFIRVEGGGHLALGERVPEVLDWIARTLSM